MLLLRKTTWSTTGASAFNAVTVSARDRATGSEGLLDGSPGLVPAFSSASFAAPSPSASPDASAVNAAALRPAAR